MLAVLVIVAAIAIPSLHYMVLRARANRDVQQLYSALSYARLAAVKEQQVVTLCHSRDQRHCSGHWSDGYILFIDHNRNHLVDKEDHLLRTYGPIASQANLSYTGFPAKDYLQILPAGYNKQQNGTFRYCDNEHREYLQRGIVVNKAGRTRLLTGAEVICV